MGAEFATLKEKTAISSKSPVSGEKESQLHYATIFQLQRALGNQATMQILAGTMALRIRISHTCTPVLARQPLSLGHSIVPGSLSDAELYSEIQEIQQWLQQNPGDPEKDQLLAALQTMENEVRLRQKPKAGDSVQGAKKPSQSGRAVESTGPFRSVNVTQIDDMALEEEYQRVQERLLNLEQYPERSADESYLQTIEAEITKRQAKKDSGSQPGKSATKIVLDYDIFTLPDGRMKSTESANELIHDWQKLEQVYFDASQGNPRVRQFIKDLEQTFNALGRTIAGQYAQCEMVPARQCWVNWDNFSFLRTDKPGAVRLRYILHDSFEARMKEINAWTQLAAAFANVILAGVIVKGALMPGEAAIGTLGESEGVLSGESKATVTGEGKVAAGEARGAITTGAEGGETFTVVEIGAGDLKASIELAKKGGVRVVAVDPSAPAAEAVTQLESHGGKFIQGTAESINTASAHHVFQYFPWRIGGTGSMVTGGTWRLIQDAVRLLKPNGVAHFVTEDFATAEYLAKEASTHGLRTVITETTAGAAAPGASGVGVPNFSSSLKVWMVNIYK